MTDRVDSLKKGIAVYIKEQKILLRLLRRKGKITDVEFDRFFSEYKTRVDSKGHTQRYRRAPSLRFLATNGAFLLGSWTQGDWSKWLHLTQIMFVIGLVKITGTDDNVTYSPTDQGLRLISNGAESRV